MRKPGGYLIITDPGEPGMTREHDTFTCGHCQRITVVKAFCDPADMGGRCFVCDRLICKMCVSMNGCDVIEKKLERSEARGRLFREMGL